MAVFRIDERLVEALEHVGLDLMQAEAAGLERDAAHQIVRVGVEQPVEEVRLDHAADTGLLEGPARQQVARRGHGNADHVHGNGLGDHGKVRVLKEEIIGVHRRAVDLLQALCPELPLEARLGVSPAIGPSVAQVTQGALPGGAETAELLDHRLWVRG